MQEHRRQEGCRTSAGRPSPFLFIGHRWIIVADADSPSHDATLQSGVLAAWLILAVRQEDVDRINAGNNGWHASLHDRFAALDTSTVARHHLGADRRLPFASMPCTAPCSPLYAAGHCLAAAIGAHPSVLQGSRDSHRPRFRESPRPLCPPTSSSPLSQRHTTTVPGCNPKVAAATSVYRHVHRHVDRHVHRHAYRHVYRHVQVTPA